MPSSPGTAATESTTLSLHDALPIFGGKLAGERVDLGVARHDALRDTRGAHLGFRATNEPRDCGVAKAQALRLAQHLRGQRKARAREDRKSTRLNSSHGYISYAVFSWYGCHRVHHSFPTRRSSDLRRETRRRACRSGRSAARCPARYARRAPRFPCHQRAPRLRRRKSPGASPRAASPRAEEGSSARRSEEHTSELQSRLHLVCRLLLVRLPPSPPLFPYTTLFRSSAGNSPASVSIWA